MQLKLNIKIDTKTVKNLFFLLVIIYSHFVFAFSYIKTKKIKIAIIAPV